MKSLRSYEKERRLGLQKGSTWHQDRLVGEFSADTLYTCILVPDNRLGLSCHDPCSFLSSSPLPECCVRDVRVPTGEACGVSTGGSSEIQCAGLPL